MKAPQAPIKQSLYTPSMPMAWMSYFTLLFTFLKQLPSSGEALPEHADDTAAQLAGLPIYGYYRTGSVVKQRVV